jgi:hypothetical protein
LEIGVWRGKAALELAIQARKEADERCVLVDMHIQLPDLQYEFARLGMLVNEHAIVIEGDARALSRMKSIVEPPGRYRWIHVDEEHSAAAILEELERAESLLCDGGIVCINAYMSPTHPQVTSAILRYVEEANGGLRMFLGGFDKAYFTTPSHFQHYMDFCYRDLITELEMLEAYTTLTKKTRATDSLNFFGICDRHLERRFLGLDGDDERVEY